MEEELFDEKNIVKDPRTNKKHSHHHGHHSHHHSHHHSKSKKHKIKRKLKKLSKSIKKNIKKNKKVFTVLCILVVVLITGIIGVELSLHKDNTDNTSDKSIIVRDDKFTEPVLLVDSTVKDFVNNTSPSAYMKLDEYRNKLGRLDVGKAVTISFDVTETAATSVISYSYVEISENNDFSDIRKIKVKGNQKSVDVYLLKTNTQYYYRVTSILADKSELHAEGKFKTDVSPRVISIEGINNVRDLGGWLCSDKGTIKQNMIFRGSEIDGAVEPDFYITSNGISDMTNALGIKTEIDLRNKAELESSFNMLGGNVKKVNCSINAYKNIFGTDKATIKNIFTVLSDKNNYPMYIHCTYGVDRTGTLCYLIEGLLGVNENDLVKDYELSSLYTSSIYIDKLYEFKESIKNNYKADTLQKSIELYLSDCGITNEQIQQIKDILIEK